MVRQTYKTILADLVRVDVLVTFFIFIIEVVKSDGYLIFLALSTNTKRKIPVEQVRDDSSQDHFQNAAWDQSEHKKPHGTILLLQKPHSVV